MTDVLSDGASAAVRAAPIASMMELVGYGECFRMRWNLASVALIAALERFRTLQTVSLVQRQCACRALPGKMGVLGGVMQKGHCLRSVAEDGVDACALVRFLFVRFLVGFGGGGGSNALLAALYLGLMWMVRVWTLLRWL